jgi:sigma-B regulation protein RsbU (phosphoserine phosphatase)
MPGTTRLAPETKYRLLLEISQKISRTLELPELLRELLDSVRSAVPYDAAGVFVLNRSVPLATGGDRTLIAGMALVGFPPRPAADDPMLVLGKGIVGHVIRTGEPVIAPDAQRDPRYVAGRPSTRSEVAVPIVSGGVVIGALNLESDQRDAFTASDAELLDFFAVAAATAIEKALLHRQVLDKHRIESQLAIARDVQASLLPASPSHLPGYDLAGVNLPTWEIGGDYYDYIPLPDRRLGLVVADVSGKGVPAALIMATFRAALRTELRRETEAADVMRGVNRLLCESSDAARFVTAVYGTLHADSGRFAYVNCGHNPPILLASGGAPARLDPGGPALGLLPDADFEPGSVTLDPGGTLALYTDGVVEVTDDGGTEYGAPRLERALRRSIGSPARDVIRAVVDDTRSHSGREGYDDDFTLLVVKRET